MILTVLEHMPQTHVLTIAGNSSSVRRSSGENTSTSPSVSHFSVPDRAHWMECCCQRLACQKFILWVPNQRMFYKTMGCGPLQNATEKQLWKPAKWGIWDWKTPKRPAFQWLPVLTECGLVSRFPYWLNPTFLRLRPARRKYSRT